MAERKKLSDILLNCERDRLDATLGTCQARRRPEADPARRAIDAAS